MPASYYSLNTAAGNTAMDQRVREAIGSGSTEVWYRKENAGVMHGIADPDIAELEETHTLIGCIACRDLEGVFYAMQGERWSPTGEANHLILSLKLHHTSMSVGDLVVLDSHVHIVRSTSFADLGVRPLVPLLAIVSGDGYMFAASDDLERGQSHNFWPPEYREGEGWDIITIQVPKDMVEPLTLHGTSNQVYSDGYEAWQEVLKRGDFNEGK